MGNTVHFFLAVLDQILFIFAGNDNIHKSLAKFEIWPDPTKERLKSMLPLFVGCYLSDPF